MYTRRIRSKSLISKLVSLSLLGIIWVAQTSVSNAQELLDEAFQNMSIRAKQPERLKLEGDMDYAALGDRRREQMGYGVRMDSVVDRNGDGELWGVARFNVELKPTDGRWFRLSIRGLAQEGFVVDKDDVWMSVEFFRDSGKNSLDQIRQRFYQQVKTDRVALVDKGRNRNLDASVWRTFDLVFKTPFVEVDSLEVTIGYENGIGTAPNSQFWISEISLLPIAAPASYEPPKPTALGRDKQDVALMIPLGGRWYYDPRDGSKTPPEQFDHTNSDRLLYLTDRLEAPFAGNMTSWRRSGYLDTEGNPFSEDSFVKDNVLIMVTDRHLAIRSRNLPNHPTAVFPDRNRGLDGNPNYIQERITTTRIPLEPRENPNRTAMQNGTNENGALPKGPIGFATNGIVFFNPFDHLQTEDAIWRLDRCCGHPAPDYQYHYHKYPVCVKSPWADDGRAHSPVIGFAADGYPICGPYEKASVLAKDETSNPLNEYNIHFDDERGWHYHVTPGRFPHVIGGFWGIAESRRTSRREDSGRLNSQGNPQGRPDDRRPPSRRPPKE